MNTKKPITYINKRNTITHNKINNKVEISCRREKVVKKPILYIFYIQIEVISIKNLSNEKSYKSYFLSICYVLCTLVNCTHYTTCTNFLRNFLCLGYNTLYKIQNTYQEVFGIYNA